MFSVDPPTKGHLLSLDTFAQHRLAVSVLWSADACWRRTMDRQITKISVHYLADFIDLVFSRTTTHYIDHWIWPIATTSMRKILTSEQKVEVMKALDSGGSCRDVALKFGVWKIAVKSWSWKFAIFHTPNFSATSLHEQPLSSAFMTSTFCSDVRIFLMEVVAIGQTLNAESDGQIQWSM